MLQHHPDIHLLTEYAAGSLSTAHSICMAVHLQHCPQCQAQLRHHSDLGAVLLESEQPSQISDNLLDSVLAKLDDGSVTQEIDSKAETAWLENSAGEFQLPAVVQKVMALKYEQLAWQSLGRKLKFFRLRADDPNVELGLYRIGAGASIPAHTHRGEEITVVLKGSFSDHLGVYGPGDFTYRTAADQHMPVATQDEECLCISSLSAPVKFTGVIRRALNPFLKIHPQ